MPHPTKKRGTGAPTIGPSRDEALRIATQGSAGRATDAQQQESRIRAINDSAPRFFSQGFEAQGGAGAQRNQPRLNNPQRSATGGQVPVTPATEAVRDKQKADRFGTLPTDTTSDAYFQAIVFGDPDKISEMSAEERAFKFEQFDRLVARRDQDREFAREEALFNEGSALRESDAANQLLMSQQVGAFLRGEGPDPRLIAQPEQTLTVDEQFRQDRGLEAEAEVAGYEYDPVTQEYTKLQETREPRPIPQTLRSLGIQSFEELAGISLDDASSAFGEDAFADQMAEADKKGIPIREVIFGHQSIDPRTGQPNTTFDIIDSFLQEAPPGTTQQDMVDTINEFLDDLDVVQNNPVPAGFRDVIMDRYGLTAP